MAEFKLDRIRFRWVGVWNGDQDTTYIKDDIVGFNGKAYVCLVGHTPSSFFYDDLTPIVPAHETSVPKWELMFDGGVWKVDWSTNTSYVEGDIAKYNGYIYRCIEAHTTPINPNLGIQADIEKWEIVFKTNNWTDEWTTNIYYELGDVVRYNGYVYSCNMRHRSATSMATGLEADQSKWTLINSSQSWQGDWSTGTRYRYADIVRYGGIMYQCIEGHTSAATDELGLEDDASKWSTYLSGIEYKHLWTTDFRYKINDIVKYGSTLWRCIGDHTSDASSFATNSADWEVWLPGLLFDREWNPNVDYQKGDIVLYGGYAYTALTNSIGSLPSTNNLLQDTGDWELLKQGYVHRGEWQSSNTYYPGDVVRVRGDLYIALVDSTLTHPDVSGWQLLVPGSNWQAEWESTKEYYIDDIVTYASTSYACILRHDADTIGSRPDLDTLNTYWVTFLQGTPTNVLTTRGDLKHFTDANGDDRLGIGTAGYTLEVDNNGAPNWANFQTVNKVYYVAPNGVDSLDAGTTLNAPFKTIRFACNFILDDEAARAPATIFIKSGIYEEIIPISIPANVALVGDELRSATIVPAPAYELNNMFFVRNASGIRNLTLQGLSGTLGAPNAFGTRRPTAGAFVSLDPGSGNTDESVWITTRSPYVQNVTTFGTGCVGMKIDGSLHNGGNKSIVANDFTQIISDGIGYWALYNGLSELVSVFTYFCHIGYLSENGGRLRGTNGNNSYGLYGSVAEGFNPSEDFITATVNNRSQEAQVDIAHTNGSEIIALAYSNCGSTYSSATLTINGSGYGFDGRYNEFRNTAIFEVRATDTDGNNIFGGLNYQYLLNSAQGGDDVSITLAAADVTGTNALYAGQRITIVQGLGIGQYGYITSYDDLTKIALISKDIDGTPGWESLYPGRPIVTSLDTSTRYSLEPRVIVDEPQWTPTSEVSPYNVAGLAYSNGTYAIVADSGWSAFSTNGTTWNSVSRAGIDVSYIADAGAGNFVALPDTSQTILYHWNGTTWATRTINSFPNLWVAATYDADADSVVVIGSGTRHSTSNNNGISWVEGNALPSSGHIDVAAGSGIVVAIKPGDTFAVTTDNATSWTTVTAPISRDWTRITYGNGRFVVVGDTTDTLYSFDGTTWYQGSIPLSRPWSNVKYAGGLFVAVNSTDNRIATSQCGQNWRVTTQAGTDKSFTLNQPYVHLAAGEVNGIPTWIGANEAGTTLGIVKSGATAIVRAIVTSSRIQKFLIYEPGSGYDGVPTVTIDDNGATETVTYDVRLGDGALSQPVFYNRGLGFVRATAVITGNGYADIYQNSSTLYVTNLSRLPGPGDNLEIDGINSVVYKISTIDSVTGVAPSLSGRITITPTIDRNLAPEHLTDVIIRQNYSQVRLTGHDFLDVGSGNVGQTQYPDIYLEGFTPINEPQPFNEVVESGGGRVFYTSTDQDGNFRVGELFKVEQSTGIVSVNASYFDLTGLSELSLGGIQVGGTAVVIRDFSKDQNFSANSNNVVPTQRAIIAYLESRISSGGADAVTNVLIAGQVRISSNNVTTTSGLPIQAIPKINILGGTDGHYLASMYYAFGSMVG
jgi:hypothetical protein